MTVPRRADRRLLIGGFRRVRPALLGRPLAALGLLRLKLFKRLPRGGERHHARAGRTVAQPPSTTRLPRTKVHRFRIMISPLSAGGIAGHDLIHSFGQLLNARVAPRGFRHRTLFTFALPCSSQQAMVWESLQEATGS